MCSDDSNDEGEPSCANESEIDDFISGMTISTWVIQSKIDFAKYDPLRKIQHIQEKFGEVMLTPDIAKE